MTKIEKQKLLFIDGIDTTQWTSYDRKKEVHYLCTRNVFKQYHNVMIDFISLKKEDFVKKWWLPTFESINNISLLKNIINNQNAKYDIDWESAAIQITNRHQEKLAYILDRIKLY
jgi:hypothetical protein